MTDINKQTFCSYRKFCKTSESPIAKEFKKMLDEIWQETGFYRAKKRSDKWTISFREALDSSYILIQPQLQATLLDYLYKQRLLALAKKPTDALYNLLLPWVEDYLFADSLNKTFKLAAKVPMPPPMIEDLAKQTAEMSQRILSKEPRLAELFTQSLLVGYIQVYQTNPVNAGQELFARIQALPKELLLSLLDDNTEITCALLTEEQIVRLATRLDNEVGGAAERAIDKVVRIINGRTGYMNRPSLVHWQQQLQAGRITLQSFDQDLFYQGIAHGTSSDRLELILASGKLLSRRYRIGAAIATAADDQLLQDNNYVSTFVGFNRTFPEYQFGNFFPGKRIAKITFNISVMRDPTIAAQGRLKMVDFLAPRQPIQLTPQLKFEFGLLPGGIVNLTFTYTTPTGDITQIVPMPLLRLVKIGLDAQLTDWLVALFYEITQVGQVGEATPAMQALYQYIRTLYYDPAVPLAELISCRREFVQRVCAYSEINLIDHIPLTLENLDNLNLGDGRILDFNKLCRYIQRQDWESIDGMVLRFPELALLQSVRDSIPAAQSAAYIADWRSQLEQRLASLPSRPAKLEAIVPLGKIGEELVLSLLFGLTNEKQFNLAQLPAEAQQDLLFYLHDLAELDPAPANYPDNLLSYVLHYGGQNFVLYWKMQPLEQLKAFLQQRHNELRLFYQQDLARTKDTYTRLRKQTRKEKRKEAQAAAAADATSYDPLALYIPLDVESDAGSKHGAAVTAAAAGAGASSSGASTSAAASSGGNTAPEMRTSLTAITTQFLSPQTPARVLLIKGDAGAGKSLALKYLYRQLKQAYDLDPHQPQVIYIELKAFNRANVGRCIWETLKRQTLDLTSTATAAAALNRQSTILLLDGYDEIAGQSQENLYQSHEFEHCPQLKMIVTCRNQYLTAGYEGWFMPYQRGFSCPELLQVTTLAPFSPTQIDAYITAYTSRQSDLPYTLAEYRTQLQNPQLTQLITNPFMLWILVESLPEFIAYAKAGKTINRAALYTCFMRYWFVKQERRIQASSGLPENWSAVANFSDFSQKLAILLHVSQQIEIEYQSDAASTIWSDYLSNRDPNIIRTRSGCPLQKVDESRYSFMHKSFLEYFTACYMLSILDNPAKLATQLGAEISLKPKHLVTEAAVIAFLNDMIELDPSIKERCFAYLESSKTLPDSAPIAAYAITMLALSNTCFSGRDLHGIRIPEADVVGGIFDGTDLRGADLREVEMRSVWLRNADLRGSLMAGVRFGELPSLVGHSGGVTSCAFSPDGKILASGSDDHTVRLWDVTNGTVLSRLMGHSDRVNVCVFSQDGKFLASGSDDNTVRLWDVASGTEFRCLKGHSKHLRSCVFSPDSKFLASGSNDETVRLWDVASGTELRCMKRNNGWVLACVFSPDGKFLVSGSKDNTVQHWDVTISKEFHCLKGHSDFVVSCIFSPDSKFLISRSDDHTARLWDVASGAELRCLRGHSSFVTFYAFSPDSKFLISRSNDNTVWLWDMTSGTEPRCLKGHSGSVTACAFSLDGKILALGSGHIVRLWDVASGEELRCLNGHSDVNDCVFSSDSKFLISRSNDNTVWLWDMTSGTEPRCLEEHEVKACIFSPDGKLLASIRRDKTVRLWDVASGTELRCLKVHSSYLSGMPFCIFSPDSKFLVSVSWDYGVWLWDVTSNTEPRCLDRYGRTCVFSPDGKLLALISSANTVRIWDVASCTELCCFCLGHSNRVVSCVFSPDGKYLAFGIDDHTVQLWDVASGKETRCLKGHNGVVYDCVFSPDGKYLASGSTDHTVRIWDVANIVNIREFDCIKGHSDVNACVFSPDGKVLASGGGDKIVRFWDMANGIELRCLKGHSGDVYTCVFSSDGKFLASGSGDKTVRLWDVTDGKELRCLKGHSDKVTACIFSQDGKVLASGSLDKTVRFWDVTNVKEFRYSKGHSGNVNVCVFLSDGKVLASGSDDKTVRLWDVASGIELCCLKGHSSGVNACVFLSDGKLIASGSWDDTVRLWDVINGKELCCVRGAHSGDIMSCVFSPDGKFLASGTDDDTVRLWDVTSGKEHRCLKGHSGAVSACVFSSDGKFLASGSWDNTVCLWDVTRGKELYCLSGHSKVVRACVFSPDGKFLASGSGDKTVRLWDVASGTELCCLNGHNDDVTYCAFSSDGKFLASGSMDKTVRFWDVVSRACVYELKDFYATVYSIAWKKNLLVVGTGNDIYTFEMYYTPAPNNKIAARLIRINTASGSPLCVENAQIEGVIGLSAMNHRLLTQRNATGNPQLTKVRTVKPPSKPLPAVPARKASAPTPLAPSAPSTSQPLQPPAANPARPRLSTPSTKATPLIFAVMNNRTDTVKQLLIDAAQIAQVNIDATSYGGCTALMIAAQKGYEDIVTLLLQAGAQTDLTSQDGKTALQFAENNGHKAIVKMIQKARKNEKPPAITASFVSFFAAASSSSSSSTAEAATHVSTHT